MKRLVALPAIFLVVLSAQMVRGKTDWIDVSLSSEAFTVQMPEQPHASSVKVNFEQFDVEGTLYSVTADRVEYDVWSLKNHNFANFKVIEGLSYGDKCADLLWEFLLKPWREPVEQRPNVRTRMSYAPGLQAIKTPGRDYTLILDNTPGVVHFSLEQDQIYVLVVRNANFDHANMLRFMNSFQLKSELQPAEQVLVVPQVLTNPSLPEPKGGGVGAGYGPGVMQPSPPSPTAERSTTIDYNRIFNSKDVTEKAKILSKVDPHYSESARKYSVTGTVRIRAVLSKTGEVTDIHVLNGLPHGLTFKATEAAKQIKFAAATKDGHTVSQYILLEYNFNLY